MKQLSLLLVSFAMCAACSRNAEPASTAERIGPTPESAVARSLPRDFLGVTLGEPLPFVECDSKTVSLASQTAPCVDQLGAVILPPDKVPTGIDFDLRVRSDDKGVSEISATVQEGAVLTAGKLVEKYGPAPYALADGELQWHDDFMHVLYVPPTNFKTGFIVVKTKTAEDADRRRRQEADARSF